MGTEVDTKEQGEPLSRETAQQAYEMRRKGRSVAYIVDHLGIDDVSTVIAGIKSVQADDALDANDKHADHVRMEVERLDAIQAEMWEIVETEEYDYDKDGEKIGRSFKDSIAAAKVVVSCIKERSALLGLTKVDNSSLQAAVIVVGGEEASYIESLKEAIPAHELPATVTVPQGEADVVAG